MCITFVALIFAGTIYAQNEDTSENRDSLLKQNLARFIRSDYTNWDSLKTDSDHGFCLMMNKDSSLFTGTAYKIEYGKDSWFLNEGGSSNNDVRLKIVSSVKGLRKGVSLIIDPMQDFSFLSPNTELEDMVVDENPDMVRMKVFDEEPITSVKKDLVFRFENFWVEYFDVSAMVHFEDAEYFSMSGTKLVDFNFWELVDFEDISDWLVLEEQKNKYLGVSLTSVYGRSEQFGHYETDHSKLYYEVPPYSCGPKTIISAVKILEDFQPRNKE